MQNAVFFSAQSDKDLREKNGVTDVKVGRQVLDEVETLSSVHRGGTELGLADGDTVEVPTWIGDLKDNDAQAKLWICSKLFPTAQKSTLRCYGEISRNGGSLAVCIFAGTFFQVKEDKAGKKYPYAIKYKGSDSYADFVSRGETVSDLFKKVCGRKFLVHRFTIKECRVYDFKKSEFTFKDSYYFHFEEQ